MKKFTVISLAALLILAFGATAFAAEAVKLEFRASGSIDAQTHYSKNVPPLNAAATPIYNSIPADYRAFDPVSGSPTNATNHKVSYWDSRMSLRFDAVMGKELSGTLQFEIDSTRWGNAQGAARPGTNAHAVGTWSTDQAAVEVKYMYFDVGLPYFGLPFPMNVRVGAQPLAIRPWFFQATDGMGISGGIKIDPININPFYFKPAEGVDWDSDDVEIWGLQANAKLGTFTVGGYWEWCDAKNYPIGPQPFIVAPPAVYAKGVNNADFYWLGLYTDGKAGPVNIQFDAAYDWGKVKQDNGLLITARNVKYSGWAARAKVDYPFEKFNFGFTGMYASGSDAKKTTTTGLAGATTFDGGFSHRVSGWMVPVGSENGAANGESVVIYGMEAGASGGQGWAVNHNYDQVSKGAFGGTWFAKIAGSYMVTPWYKVTLQGLYIGDTTKNGNTFGNARGSDGQPRDDDTIGVEIDMLNEIAIYKNLTFKLFGGYLFAGEAMNFNTTKVTGTDFNTNIKNPWAIRTRLLYSF
jgi:hypothetical protein